jgi:hypothetical protein
VAVSSSADPYSRPRPAAVAGGGAWRTFLRRWGISLASLASGFATLVIFRRGVPHVGWIIGYVVVLWLLFAVLSQLRGALLARGRHLVVAAGDYTIQTLYHGLLLFVLPGYFASTTFDSATAVFFAALAAAALLTTVDPWYRVVVHPRPWLGLAFCGFALFAGLNVALPLVGVPPAPISLVRPTLARAVADLEPLDPVTHVTREELRAWGGVVAFTPVAAPAALRQPIEHRWRHEGRVVSTVRLTTPVQGGRPGGFRTFSRKTDFPHDAEGRWTVDVVTASGQLIGRLRFRVDA